jgi:A/G-specific adenine glycosylase
MDRDPTLGLNLNPLFRWFRRHKRNLPWRAEPRDPYRVWLSEVMLQQTQVSTMLPYYHRWLRRFATLHEFAAASIDDVLKLWEGLGYYARARNFHRAAQTVVHDFGGRIPSDVDQLITLPGIGPYTAGAIASLAFNRDVPVLDGNVRRVLSRLFARLDATDDDLWRLTAALLPRGRAAMHNESLMELGAIVCTPRGPRCAACPLRPQCLAFAQGEPESYPAKPRKSATPHYPVVTAALVDRSGRVLLGRRARDGLLGGLWEFVSSEYRTTSPVGLERVIENRTGLKVDARRARALGKVTHAFSHFRITREVWLLPFEGDPAVARPIGYDELTWASPDEVRDLALTGSDRKILALCVADRESALAVSEVGGKEGVYR